MPTWKVMTSRFKVVSQRLMAWICLESGSRFLCLQTSTNSFSSKWVPPLATVSLISWICSLANCTAGAVAAVSTLATWLSGMLLLRSFEQRCMDASDEVIGAVWVIGGESAGIMLHHPQALAAVRPPADSRLAHLCQQALHALPGGFQVLVQDLQALGHLIAQDVGSRHQPVGHTAASTSSPAFRKSAWSHQMRRMPALGTVEM